MIGLKNISLSNNSKILDNTLKISNKIESSISKISTGNKLNIEQDSADYQIAKSLEQRSKTSSIAKNNISTAANMMKVAEGAINSAISILQKMRELTVQYYDGSLSESDKDAIKDRLNMMGIEVNQIINDAKFNDHNLFNDIIQTFIYHVGSDSNDQFEIEIPAMDLDLSFDVDPIVDLVILMDNSGSLGDEQLGVKNNIQNLIDELEAEDVDLALGLTRFGASVDGGDPQVGELTTDSEYFVNTILETNTVDGSIEPAYDAIKETAENMTFRDNSDKFFMIIGNENPDQGIYNENDALNAMQNIDATLFAVTENSLYDDYEEITEATDGQAININDDFSSVLSDITDAIFEELEINFIDKVDTALEKLIKSAQTIGSAVNRLTIKEKFISEHILNTEAARSRIEDTDFAKEIINKMKAEILFNVSQKQLYSEINSPNYILKILQG